MSISTFGMFTMARLGIYASTQALTVTGNNVSNINTEGYTRQVVDQFSAHLGQGDRYRSEMDVRIGSGVLVNSILQTRDAYLDIRYRNEQSSVGGAEEMLDGLTQLSSVLDEVGMGEDGEGILEAAFNNMVEQMDILAAQGAGKDSYDTIFRESMSSLVTQVNKTADNLTTLMNNERIELEKDITTVNGLLERIRDLNTAIRNADIYGDSSLEQRDERNLVIDQLSKYMRIDVSYEEENINLNHSVEKLVIRTGDLGLSSDMGVPEMPQRVLIDGIFSTALSFHPNTDNYSLDLAALRDAKGHSTELRIRDLGAIKNLDMGPITDEETDEPIIYPDTESAEAAAAELNESGDGSEYKVTSDEGLITIHKFGVMAYDDRATAEQALLEYQAAEEVNIRDREFVNEVNGEVTKQRYEVVDMQNGQYEIHIKEIFYGKVQLSDSELHGSIQSCRELLTRKGIFSTESDLAGDPFASEKRGIPFYQRALDVFANRLAAALNDANKLPDEVIYEMSGNDFVDADGNIVTGERSKYVLKEEYSDYNGGILLSNQGNSNDDTGITAANISISRNWANGTLRVLRSKQPNAPSTQNDNLNHIANILTARRAFYPNNEGLYEKSKSEEMFCLGSFQDLLTNHISGTLASDRQNTTNMLQTYTAAADDLNQDRDAVSGVDLNDETMNLMMYQKSYSAACRLMTVFDEMIDKLVNGTAV